MSITPSNLALVYGSAYTALDKLSEMPGHDSNRSGGYLVLMDKRFGMIQAVLLVGEPDEPRARRYHRLALEKAERLYFHTSHVSSHQSRDEASEMFTGAIKAKHVDLIFSFSGLSQTEDEIISLMAAIGMGAIKIEEAKEIAAISGNTRFTEYLNEYGPK